MDEFVQFFCFLGSEYVFVNYIDFEIMVPPPGIEPGSPVPQTGVFPLNYGNEKSSG